MQLLKILILAATATVVFADEKEAIEAFAKARQDPVSAAGRGRMAQATEAEIVDFNRAIAQVIARLKVDPSDDHDGTGYRIISNSGSHGMQDVPHLHMHILAGRALGQLVDAQG